MTMIKVAGDARIDDKLFNVQTPLRTDGLGLV